MFGTILILVLSYCINNFVDGRTCDTWHKTDRGTIAAYNYNNASRIVQCIYRIKTRPNSWIKLQWQKLGVDGGTMPNCNDDSVIVYTGCGGSGTRVARFCTKNMKLLPHNIYSRDNCMRIIFSNPSGKSRGFNAFYRSYPMSTSLPSTCSNSLWTRTKISLTGVTGSPSWPSTRRYNKGTCGWKIKTGDSGKRYVLNVMDMNLYSGGGGCHSSWSDIVYIKGQKSMTTKKKKSWTFCNFQSYDGNIINTEYYQIYMRMTIRTSRPGSRNRGFLIGYVAYEDDVARALTSWGSIIGGLVLALITVIFVFFCYRRHRRRQMQQRRVPIHNEVVAPTVNPPPHIVNPSYPMQPLQPSYPPPTTYPNAPPVYSDKPPPYASPPGAVPPTYPQYPPQGYPPPSNQANSAYPT